MSVLKLLLKSTSPRKTSKLSGNTTAGAIACKAVRHDSVVSDEYVLQNRLTLDSTYLGVRYLVGSKIMEFVGRTTGKKLFVYGQKRQFEAVVDSIALPDAEFDNIWSRYQTGSVELAVRNTWFLWGSELVIDRNTSAVRMPLDKYVEVPAAPVAKPNLDKQPAPIIASVIGLQREVKPVFPPKVNPPKQAPRGSASRSSGSRGSSMRGSSTPYQRPVREHDDGDGIGDFMFMSMFPEVAPIYRPNSMLAWYLWSQSHSSDNHYQQPFAGQGGTFDGGGATGNWTNVPGFPDAASQRITPQDGGQQVQLLDNNGQAIGSFFVATAAGNTSIKTEDGHVFSIAGGAQPSVQFTGQNGQSFAWDGSNEPVLSSIQNLSSENMQVSSSAFADFLAPDSTPDLAAADVAAAIAIASGSGTSVSTTADSPSEPSSMDSSTAY